MTAAALLAELQGAGIRLCLRGDKLRAEAKPGTVTPALRALLTQNKAALVAALQSKMREHLLALSAGEALPAGTVHRLHADDVAACAGQSDDTLRAYLVTLDRGTVMDGGVAPEGYTQAAHCDGCGPVWLWQGAPARVVACPWCFRRKAGNSFARPLVTSKHARVAAQCEQAGGGIGD